VKALTSDPYSSLRHSAHSIKRISQFCKDDYISQTMNTKCSHFNVLFSFTWHRIKYFALSRQPVYNWSRLLNRSWRSIFGRGWKVRNSNPVKRGDFSLLQNVQTGSRAHPASYSMRTDSLSRGQSGQSVKLTTHHHVVPRLRGSGSTLLLPLYALMA
jgi:hypothetical protein